MNRLTQILSLKYPIVQGPFGGGLSSVELVKVVADFGGLGSFGAHYLSPNNITSLVYKIKQATQGEFAINLWVPNDDYYTAPISQVQHKHFSQLFNPIYKKLRTLPPRYKEIFSENYEEQVRATIEAKPPAISFAFGVPSSETTIECREKGIVTIGTATSLMEALELEGAGIDLIVASGLEAGGHRVSFIKEAEHCLTGSFSLIPQIVDKVSVPVIAAGGIVDSRGVCAAMALGAQGVQVGTAFLACNESGTSPMHKRELLSDQESDTILSRAFTGRLARFIENDFIRYVEKHSKLPLPYPLQNYFVNSIKSAATSQERADYAPLYAGQSTPLIRHANAYDLMKSLTIDFV